MQKNPGKKMTDTIEGKKKQKLLIPEKGEKNRWEKIE
jgi:hypothetical protein